jgi:hypothetical protein
MKQIPETAGGQDQLGMVRIDLQLGPKPRHVNVDDP